MRVSDASQLPIPGVVMLSWTWACVLQSCDSLPSGDWHDVERAPLQVDGENRLILPATTINRLFRLRQP